MMDDYNAEQTKLDRLVGGVTDNPDDFESWEKAVSAIETYEGGLNRNSSDVAISTARNVLDRLLAKFPLFFGYWKKYAELEFSISGTEGAEAVYERAIASFANSVDLWAAYGAFKMDTCHDQDIIRELFERGSECVGLDFMSHPFWDKYLEFEERSERPDNIFSLLGRIIHIPLHQYSRYFQRYRLMAHDRKLEELGTPELLQRMLEEVEKENPAGRSKSAAEVDRDVRTQIDAHYVTIYNQTQAETTKRWVFEQNIKRPFFHVTDLEESEIDAWRKYMDWEETEGDFQRIMFLYERCLVPAASYDEFWLRYARWMQAQGKVENARIIYQKASCIFAPIAKPEIRYSWSLFEEAQGSPSAAEAILEGILVPMPGHFDTIMRWANLKQRQEGPQAALEIIQKQADSGFCSYPVKGALTVQAARLLRKIHRSPDEARALFQSNTEAFNSVQAFWTGWLAFEMEEQLTSDSAKDQLERVRAVHSLISSKSALPPDTIKELSSRYLQWLLENGGPNIAKEYMEFDIQINGPESIRTLKQRKQVPQ